MARGGSLIPAGRNRLAGPAVTNVGDPVYSAGLVGRVSRVVGVAPHEQIYVDWTMPADRPLEVNPDALPPEEYR